MRNACDKPRGHLGPHVGAIDYHVAQEQGLCGEFTSGRFKDRRPCPDCGHVGIRQVWPADDLGKYGEVATPCSACRFGRSALKHEHAARRAREKQAAILRRRKR